MMASQQSDAREIFAARAITEIPDLHLNDYYRLNGNEEGCGTYSRNLTSFVLPTPFGLHMTTEKKSAI